MGRSGKDAPSRQPRAAEAGPDVQHGAESPAGWGRLFTDELKVAEVAGCIVVSLQAALAQSPTVTAAGRPQARFSDENFDARLSLHGEGAARTWTTVLALADRLDVEVAEVEAALSRLLSLTVAQGERFDRSRASLVKSLQADLGLIDPLPHASVEQARRSAELRNRLLASGAWSVPAIAEVRDVTEGTARTWLKRQRDAYRLVTVAVHREVYVPAVVLDEAAEPWSGIDMVLRPLVTSGMDGWAVWTWLDTPSTWLDGQRPAELVAAGHSDRAAVAATAKASTAAA